MLYKEWTTVRLKFYLALLIYGVVALILSTVWLPLNWGYTGVKLFELWLTIGLLVSFFTAILGGVDLVSDEVDKGTLSFLLTRPIARTRIYSTKIGLNIAAFGVAFLGSSAVMLVIDRLQPSPVDLAEALGYTGLILMGGIGLICLTGLISIFTGSVMRTMAFTILLVLLIVTGVAWLSFYILLRFRVAQILVWPWQIWPLVSLLLAATAAFTFLLGRITFARKEF